MIQIEDIVVSSDVLTEKFICNLEACKGECCIEGDAGAPVEKNEVAELEKVLPVIWDELSPEAQAVIKKQGVVYTDHLLATTRKAAVIAPSRKPTVKGNVTSISLFPAIYIRYGLRITVLIRPSIITVGMYAKLPSF